jgi:CheY-like chemotaxis protein
MSEATRTVLVVEDNEIEREGLATVLRRAGYAVALIGDGREALAHIRANPAPGLILTDLMMPVLDGWRFLEELKHLLDLSAVPVIIITASPAVGPEWAEAHGCAGFLRKPFDTDALLTAVRRCLGQAPAPTDLEPHSGREE